MAAVALRLLLRQLTLLLRLVLRPIIDSKGRSDAAGPIRVWF